MSFVSYDDAQPVPALPGIVRRTLAYGEKIMICRFDLEQGASIPPHSHPHEQAGYVAGGRIRLTIEGQTAELGPGDSYSAPGGAVHDVVALEPSVVVDTFSPAREEYK